MTTVLTDRSRLRTVALAAFIVSLALLTITLVAPSASSGATATSKQPPSGCNTSLSPREEIHQLASAIERSHGTPTAEGQRVLDAEAAGDPALASGVTRATSGVPSLDVIVLATESTPAPASAAGALAAVAHASPPAKTNVASSARSVRHLSSVRRIQGWGGYYYYFCGPGVRANLAFWCHAGGTCAASAFFSNGQVLSSNLASCPGPGPGSCLTYARAQPGTPFISIDWIRPYQSYPGQPAGYAQYCGL